MPCLRHTAWNLLRTFSASGRAGSLPRAGSFENSKGDGKLGIQVGGIFGLIVLVLDVWAIVRILGSRSGTGAKVVWVVVILLLPILGLLLWLLFGPKD